MAVETPELRYGGFWPRAAALGLDLLINLPLIAFVLWAGSRYRFFQIYFFIPGTAIGLFYNVYLVRRFGGTPGKLIMRLRIRKTTGARVGYREAVLREAPSLVLGTLTTIAALSASLHMTDAEFHALSFRERSEELAKIAPGWSKPLRIANSVWTFGELAVLLTNRKRRALHDFIAGTVVVFDVTPNHAMERIPPPRDRSSCSR